MIDKKIALRLWFSVVATVLVTGCSSSNNQDLVDYMQNTRIDASNQSRIEPLPAYPPYVAVTYTSAGLRSPFDPPREVITAELRGELADAPDLSRPKEFLERFNIAELAMVGTIERNGVRWALVRDSSRSVHRVTTGNYLGRNYGRINDVRDSSVDLTEVVVNGQGGWIERPRSLNMGN